MADINNIPTSGGDNSGFKLPVPVPQDISQPVNEFTDKLTNAAEGVDGVAENLEQKMDEGLQIVEKKIDDFLGGLDNFLSKF